MSQKILMILYICVTLITLAYLSKRSPQTLNCGLSEISPDFSQAQRQQCRQIRGHKL